MDLVNRYAAALSLHPTPVEAVGEVAGEIIERFDGERPDLVVCFASPHHVGAFEDVAGALAQAARARCRSSAAPPVGGRGRRRSRSRTAPVCRSSRPRFGAGRVSGVALDAIETGDGVEISGWPDDAPGARNAVDARRSVLVPGRATSSGCATREVPELTVIGGCASAGNRPGGEPHRVRRPHPDERRGRGACAPTTCPCAPVVSQGCRPIGTPLHDHPRRAQLRARARGPARARPAPGASSDRATENDRELMREGLHLGLVVDEHRLDFERGDFLVRNCSAPTSRPGRSRSARSSTSARPCSSTSATRRRPTKTCVALLDGVHGRRAR